MAVELEMPELAESVIEGEIVKWLVKEGEHVEARSAVGRGNDGQGDGGDSLAVRRRVAQAGCAKEGDVVPIGKPIAIFGKEGETFADCTSSASTGQRRRHGGDFTVARYDTAQHTPPPPPQAPSTAVAH